MCYAYNQPLNRPASLSSSFTREIPSVGEEEELSGWLCCVGNVFSSTGVSVGRKAPYGHSGTVSVHCSSSKHQG